MEYQTLINDHTLSNLPSLYSKDELDKVAYAILHPVNYRNDDIGRWTVARNIAIFYLSYECATRPSEILHLKLSDIDFNSRSINIPPESNKLRRGRVIPVPEHSWIIVCNYIHQLKKQYWNFSPYLFPSLHNRRLSTDRWQEVLRTARIEAGIYIPRKKTAYTLRHTKATEIYEKTGDPIKVANVLGHKSLESTKVYIHLASLKSGYLEELRKAMS